jgi:hypothetical protein
VKTTRFQNVPFTFNLRRYDTALYSQDEEDEEADEDERLEALRMEAESEANNPSGGGVGGVGGGEGKGKGPAAARGAGGREEGALEENRTPNEPRQWVGRGDDFAEDW